MEVSLRTWHQNTHVLVSSAKDPTQQWGHLAALKVLCSPDKDPAGVISKWRFARLIFMELWAIFLTRGLIASCTLERGKPARHLLPFVSNLFAAIFAI